MENAEQKKADVIERPRAFAHVGLLSNGPSDDSECPLISRPTNLPCIPSMTSQCREPSDAAMNYIIAIVTYFFQYQIGGNMSVGFRNSSSVVHDSGGHKIADP